MGKPVKCERCGRENDPSFSFCLDCGRPLPRASAPAAASASTCAACGAPLLPGFRFCGRCGAAVAATTVPPATPSRAAAAAGQRRGLKLSTVRTDGAPGPVFPLEGDALVCGREAAEIRIPEDGTVSPRHARFTVSGERVTVEDLGSLNGTFLRIRGPHRLAPGEEFRVGRQLLRVEPLPRPTEDTHAWGAPDPGYRLRLVQLLDGGGAGEACPLREGENVIGRETGELIFPGDRYVSGRHARIDADGDDLTLTDLESSNGTFRRIAGPTALAAGDQLLIGTQLLKLEE